MRIACIAIAATTGCGVQAEAPPEQQPKTVAQKEDFTFTPEPARKYAQVTDAASPTLRQLKARGLTQTGWDAEMYSCGPACDAVYQYAIFVGHQRKRPAMNEHLYTCPNPEKAMALDDWRCTKFSGIRGPA